jgi:hypothetical protein
MTGTSKAHSALGARAHSGWAAYVVLAGDVCAPRLLSRGRMALCDPSIEGSKQPYHYAEPMTLARAEKYIGECRVSAAALANRSLGKIVAETGALASCCILISSGKSLPDLRSVLASHVLIHAAEGEFYRDAVADACVHRHIAVQRVRERDIAEQAEILPLPEAARRDVLNAYGKQLGPPWTQDEKLSALAAWLALAAPPARARRSR